VVRTRGAASEKPQIEVKPSNQSISIIIPKGIKLPVIATISAAGEFSTRMSEQKSRRSSQESGSSSNTSLLASEPQGVELEKVVLDAGNGSNREIAASLGLPLPVKGRNGPLNVSEASGLPQQDSSIPASSQSAIISSEPDLREHNSSVPASIESGNPSEAVSLRQEPGLPASDTFDDPPEVGPPLSDSGIPTPDQPDILSGVAAAPPQNYVGLQPPPDSDHQAELLETTEDKGAAADQLADPLTQAVEYPSTNQVLGGPERSRDPETNEESATTVSTPTIVQHIAETTKFLNQTAPDAFAETPTSKSVPKIRVQQLTASTMTSPVEPFTVNNAAIPTIASVTPTASDIPPAPASSVTALPHAPEVPTSLPVDPQALKDALPVDTMAAAASDIPLPLPEEKLGIRKRLIDKVRKLILTKKVLGVVLGREVGNTVHALLHPSADVGTVNDVAGSAPLPVDGPSDIIAAYAQHKEKQRDARLKALDRKIACEKKHAEAEEVLRCPTCRGFEETKHMRKYHRLQLEREKPDMRTIDRHAVGMARVAPFKCKCPKSILGATVNLAKSKLRSKNGEPQSDLPKPPGMLPAIFQRRNDPPRANAYSRLAP
jgi:hypothetical protein